MALRILGIALVAALSASPALAKDATGYRMIAAGNLGAAEQTLVAERRIYPQRPELMLNLAAVYERTGRSGEARALYREILSSTPVMMEMPSGDTASSHVVATAGLRTIDGGQIVSR